MRALITGIGGFVGRHLLQHLHTHGDEVCGIGRPADCAGISASVRVFMADLGDRPAVERVVRQTQPEAVYHLAAQSSPAESLHDPWATIGNNLLAQVNLFEAVLSSGIRPRVLVIGSSDEYGRVGPGEVPTHEDVPLRPTTPYAVSKVGQDVMGFQYFAQHGLPVVRVRPFNHTGPGQDARFVIPSFAHQLAEIEKAGREPVLRVGNLDVARDFSDVRDMVCAYRLALVAGVPGDVYNLGRGQSVRLTDTVNELITLCRIPVQIRVDPLLLRPADVPRQEADTRKFTALTGWQPRIAWHTTLRDTLAYWREKVEESLCAS
ncbi:MAG: GDP-mannose 4,6-dehydratase [Chloroflexota bacterium]|nr:GDP-mannose 4,6-dehydratase [Chloroflexota bacterium]